MVFIYLTFGCPDKLGFFMRLDHVDPSVIKVDGPSDCVWMVPGTFDPNI